MLRKQMKNVKPSDAIFNPLHVLKIVTWPVGIWPLNDDFFSILRTLLALAIQISLVTCATIEITLGCSTPDETIDFVEFQKFGTMAALKVISMRYYKKNLAQMITFIKEDWLWIEKSKFQNSTKGYINLGKTVFYVQTISTGTLISIQIISSFSFISMYASHNETDSLNIHREFPVRTKCLFMDVSTLSYLLICFIQSLQLISIGFGTVGIDIFFFNLIMNVCSRLEILYEEFSEFEATDDAKETKSKMIGLVKRHKHLWKEAQIVERTFGPIILVQLLINITGICTYGIQGMVNMQLHGLLAGMKSFFSVELLLVQLFLYCYAGEKLSAGIWKLSLALYRSSWYNLPKNVSQNVLFIIMVSKTPFYLTAGKMLPMNMNTFTRIAKISLIVSVTTEITLGCSSPDEVIDLLIWQQCGIIATLKVILVRFYRQNVSQIITSINADWSTIKEPTLLEIMISYGSFGNFVCNAQLIFSCSELCLLIVSNFLSGVQSISINNSSEILLQRPFPQGTKCLFMNISTTTYIFLYIFQMIQCIYTSIGNVGMDVFFFLLAMHLCGQLEILCTEICNIKGQSFKEIKTQIVSLSQRHQYLLSKAMDLEKTFSLIIMLQLASNISAISLFGIAVIVNSEERGILAAMKPMTAIQVLMIQLFLYCYAGDLLTSRIQMIAFASYECLWYEFPGKLSKDIYFIMIKAGKPFAISAGKLLPINMSTFSSILKLSLSYFSVFRLMLDARYKE